MRIELTRRKTYCTEVVINDEIVTISHANICNRRPPYAMQPRIQTVQLRISTDTSQYHLPNRPLTPQEIVLSLSTDQEATDAILLCHAATTIRLYHRRKAHHPCYIF